MRIAGWIAFLCIIALAQEESTRQLWNEEFLKERPAAKSAKAPPSRAIPTAGFLLGVTVWRLRPATAANAGETRLLVLEDGKQEEIALERMEARTALKPGDRVRLAVEVPRAGYLYVVDREQYAGGKIGEPYLIYPNWQTKPGDNATAAGRLIEIPDQRDEPNCFKIRATRADQTGELLTLLVTTEPLTGLTIGRSPLKLREEQYAEWEKRFGVRTERLEWNGGSGKPWTPQEKKAGADHSSLLTQTDPLPQTFYRIAGKPGPPVFLKLLLEIQQ
jgi:hypothetical protein